MAATTIDRLLDGRLELEQPSRGFRASIDAVFLAAAVDSGLAPAGSSARVDVLDAGCGVGAASLCLAHRQPAYAVRGLEIEPSTASLARDNVARNGIDDQVSITCGDILAPPSPLRQRQFAAVMTNPPFHTTCGQAASDDARALATSDTVGPAGWLGACLKRLAPGGQLVLIHRADRLPSVLTALDGATGQIEIIPLWPGPTGKPAKRVVIRCRKGRRTPAVLRPGLVLHEATGKFTPMAEAILRDGADLDEVLPEP